MSKSTGRWVISEWKRVENLSKQKMCWMEPWLLSFTLPTICSSLNSFGNPSLVLEDTLPATNSSYLPGRHPERKLIFQSYFCRCYDSFGEGKIWAVLALPNQVTNCWKKSLHTQQVQKRCKLWEKPNTLANKHGWLENGPFLVHVFPIKNRDFSLLLCQLLWSDFWTINSSTKKQIPKIPGRAVQRFLQVGGPRANRSK